MTKPSRFRSRSSAILAVGQVSEALLPLVRSVVLARLLTGTEFGIAVALSAVAAIVEVAADLGLDRSAVLAGAQPDAEARLATLHSLSTIRGFIVGIILAILGPIVSYILHEPSAWPAFSALGLCSVVRGCANLGVKEAMQRYSYWQEGVATTTLQTSWTVATIAAAFAIRDHRCMLIGIFVGQVLYVGASHVLSGRRWKLGWTRDYAKQMLRYGAPLIPNGIALVANTLLDRIVVGAFLGVETMGVYYTAMMAATLPRGAILRFINNLALPAFVNRDPSSPRGKHTFNIWLLVLTVITCLSSLGYLCFARTAITLVFGSHFEPSQLLISLIGLSLFTKLMLTLMVPPAMAAGMTRLVLSATVATSSSIAIGTAALAIYPAPEAMIAGVLLGETCALVWVTARSFQAFPFDRRLGVATMGPSIVALLCLALVEWVFRINLAINAAIFVVAAGALLIYSAGLEREFGLELPLGRYAFWRKRASS